MNVIDIFCGQKSIGNVFKEHEHSVLTVDWDAQHNPDICANILDLTADDLFGFYGWDHVDYLHMSPDCTTYSIAAVSHHRNKDLSPKSDNAKLADDVRKHILQLLDDLEPTYFTIENPRGLMRKMPDMQALARKYFFTTVTYCQYGDTRMKPTDIWHNIPMQFRQMCKNGDKCHESAPRGSRTGTQGLSGSVDRSKIPHELCYDIYNNVVRCLND